MPPQDVPGVRDAREAPYAENTPSSKQNFKKDSPEERRKRQGGAKPGHEGHGRREVPAEDADETRGAEAPATCPDCGAALVPVAPRTRVLRDVPPPKFANVHWTIPRGMCPCCHKTFEGEVPGAMPRFAATNRALAENAHDHYCHHMPVGVVSRRMGFNKSTILDEMRALAEILRPCVRRLRRWFRESKVRHADETTWPCNGAHGQYAWGLFARRFERLLKKEPENREYRAFVPKMCGLLAEAMALSEINGKAKGSFTGVVLYAGENTLPFGDGFYAVPLAALGA